MSSFEERQTSAKEVKNLKVNKKAKYVFRRCLLYAGLIGVLATTTVATVNTVQAINNEKQVQSIVSYYGGDSKESKILEYIGISEKLNALKLQNYDVDESLYQKYNMPNELLSPEELTTLIEKLNSINPFISSKAIMKQQENIELVLTLKKQEPLVNKYIYETGYFVSNFNATRATKQYVGEVFGIEDENNITLNYSANNTSGDENISIKYDNPSIKGDEKNYYFGTNYDIWFSKDAKNIKNGIFAMADTDSFDDKNQYDNDKYNKNRNLNIKNALKQSMILENEVANNDLYDEEMAKKMR